jgi:hypothetical protein
VCRLEAVVWFKVVLDGLVVSVFATGPKVRGFKPKRERWIFNGDNIRSTHVKEPLEA